MSNPRLVSSPYERLPLEVLEFLENCVALDLENESSTGLFFFA